MIVFLDTTELRQNPNLQGVKWEKVGRYLQQGANVGFVTELVLQETVNHVKEDLTRMRETLAKCVGNLRRLAADPTIVWPEIDVDILVSSYRQRLTARLSSLYLQTPPYPEIRINDLVQRALNRRRPFDGHGQKGFRDAVQWEVILATVRETVDDIVFVTSNKRDFGSQGLANELASDLVAIGRPNSVTICQGLDSFIREYVDPTLEKLDEIAVAVRAGEYKSFKTDEFVARLWPEIRTMIEQEVADKGIDQLGFYASQYLLDPVLSDLNDDPSIDGVEVYRMSDDVITASLTLEFQGSITCQEDSLFDPNDKPYYEPIIGDATFTVSAGAVIMEHSGEVLEEGVDSVAVQLGINWPWSDGD